MKKNGKLILTLVISIIIFLMDSITGAEHPLDLDRTNTTYYIDPAGNDNNTGTSTATPWKTINKVNSITFSAGDKILFKAGGTWTGNLKPLGSGSSSLPIIIDKYGTGSNPVINGEGLVNGSITVELKDQSYWEINNLEITNKIASGLHYAVTGINVGNSGTTAQSHITIKNCYVHDVNSTEVGNSNYNKGTGGIIFSGLINDVLVQNCHIKNCQIEGMRTSSNTRASNIVFDNNLIEDVYGDGIVFHGATGNSKITNNVVRNACISNAANFAGIWTYDSYKTIISTNEVYGLKGGSNDGQVFDADISTDGDIFEYNYSHDNARGFMLFMPDAKNIIVRYNISANDVTGGNKMFNFTATSNSNQLYNNVFYITNTINLFFENKFTGTFTNNIIYSTGSVGKFSQNPMNNTARFLNNCIYPDNAILAVNWDGCYHSSNVFFDPKFRNAIAYGVGRNTAIAFDLLSVSPCLTSGLTVAGNGGYDFFHNPIAATGKPTIGALQSLITTIDTAERSPELTLFPNPSSGEFMLILPFDEKNVVTVSTLLGKIIFRGFAAGRNAYYVLDLTDQNPGIYFLSVTDGKRSFSKKIIIVE